MSEQDNPKENTVWAEITDEEFDGFERSITLMEQSTDRMAEALDRLDRKLVTMREAATS